MNQTRWQKIETLYHLALEQDAASRAAFLEQAADGDDDLRREVESLLASHEQSGDFLSEPQFELGLEILAKPKNVFKSGQTFGNFNILKFLGRGGMGEVYLARDERLGRLVALKILPSDLASDTERIPRFVHEARSASALNHPNILTIHEIGEADGWHYIASEFIEGETLRDRLRRDEVLTAPETIAVALQIAAALKSAHKAGIVHRDIKPENIMLREDGLVKLLDFGLAKLVQNSGGETNSDEPFSTNPGMVLGTAAYMSPEQARGKRTDARSDIWSFGVVLYEMLVGRLPFQGDTTSDLIAAILTAEVDLPAIESNEKPENLWRIIEKMLRKNADERYQSVSELADDLRKLPPDADYLSDRDFYQATGYGRVGQTDPNYFSTSGAVRKTRTEDVGRKRRVNKIALALGILFVFAGSLAVLYFLKNSGWFLREPMKIARITDSGKTVTAAISPDGKYVAQAIADAGKESIWIKHLATGSNVQIVAPKEIDYPALTFSKDGNFIFYVQNNGELFQIPVLGGDPKKILGGVGSAISFSPDGQQFAFIRSLSSGETALMIAGVNGGEERQVASRKKPELFVGPAWSPDGKVIACATGNAGSDSMANIVAIPVDGGEERVISSQKWRVIWQPVWLSDGSGLIAPAADHESGSAARQIWFFPFSGGSARQITNDLDNYGDISLTADSGALVTIRSEQRSNIWLLPQGKSEEARLISKNNHALYRFIAASPDGKIIYPSQEDSRSGRNIWIMNSDGNGAKQLTANAHDNILPCATGNGRYIVFASNRADRKTYHIWRMDADGGNPVQLTNGGGERGPACSADGKTIFYTSGNPDAGMEKSRLWKVSVEGGESVQLTDYPVSWKDISPDGNYLAISFKPNPSSPVKIGIIPITGGLPEKVYEFKENSQIRWTPDGRSITYIKTEKDVSNIWEQPLNGDAPKQITKFSAENIYFFDWSRTTGDLICTRGYQARDPLLISNFR